MTLLTPHEMAYVLELHPYTLDALVSSGTIPHTYIQPGNSVRFNPSLVIEWLQSMPQIGGLFEKNYLDGLKRQIKEYSAINELKKLNSQFAPKRIPKGYSLSKVPSKKYGFLYYVRYIRNGKLVPSRWNTHTSNIKVAEQFACNNREEILMQYDKIHNAQTNIFKIIEDYYKENSKYLKDDIELGRSITDKTRAAYYSYINNRFLPYLKENGIKDYSDITPKTIKKHQINLLREGINPQSINRYLSGVSKMLDFLVSEDIITSNVMKNVKWLNISKSKQTHGCYKTDKLFGVFNKEWHDKQSYILNLIGHSTGLRNGEIERITLDNIIKIKNFYYIDIKESKTPNGIRIVPLHPFAHKKLVKYISLITPYRNGRTYEDAYILLGKKLGYTKESLKAENITFYSSRHYWKTLMSEHGLGKDIEEIFMGHKVTNDVAKLYNHNDKKGQALLLKKTREMLTILDKTLFKGLAVK